MRFIYDGETLDVGYRADLLVEGIVLVELKSVEVVFNVEQLRDGIKRVINSKPKFSVASAFSVL